MTRALIALAIAAALICGAASLDGCAGGKALVGCARTPGCLR